MKRYNIFKTVQLVLFIVLAVICLGAVLINPEVFHLVAGSLTPQNPQSLTGSYFFVIFVYLIDRNAVLCYNTLYTEELP